MRLLLQLPLCCFAELQQPLLCSLLMCAWSPRSNLRESRLPQRLFTHETWKEYTGKPILERWLAILRTWPYSTVLRAVSPISALASVWAFAIASLPRALLPRTSPVPMSLMGTALGLLLVFRTNNSYLRCVRPMCLPPCARASHTRPALMDRALESLAASPRRARSGRR